MTGGELVFIDWLQIRIFNDIDIRKILFLQLLTLNDMAELISHTEADGSGQGRTKSYKFELSLDID
jgi:hypothetical protein